MTEDFRARIMRHEGFTAMPKPDARGHDVIGYGHDITPEQATGEYADGITEAQAMELLASDINSAQAEVNHNLPWTSSLCQTRQDVLVEMTFQLGFDGLMGFKNLLFCIRSGDWDGAAQAMLDSLWHKQVPGRCEELAALMISG